MSEKLERRVLEWVASKDQLQPQRPPSGQNPGDPFNDKLIWCIRRDLVNGSVMHDHEGREMGWAIRLTVRGEDRLEELSETAWDQFWGHFKDNWVAWAWSGIFWLVGVVCGYLIGVLVCS